MRCSRRWPVLAGFLTVALAAFCISSASAQTNVSSGLVATGSYEVKLEPNKIRLSLKVQAEGKDSKSAITSLAEQKKKTQAAIIEMKAIEKSVRFEATTVTSSIAGVGNNPNIVRNLRLQLGNPNNADDENETPKIYTAQTMLVAEWELPTQDVDALSLMPEMLKTQIAQKDLQGKKLKAELSDEEQDKVNVILQRVQQQGLSYYLSNNQSGSDVRVVFIAEMTEAKEIESLGAAFEQAAASAKILAKASKVKLGKVRSIVRSDLVENQPIEYETDQFGNQTAVRPQKKGAKEVVSPSATGLSKTVSVVLTYEIE